LLCTQPYGQPSRKHLNYQQVLTAIGLTHNLLSFIICYMTLARRGVRISHAACIWYAVFCFVLTVTPLLQAASARKWDSAGAARAFQEARQKRAALAKTTKPALNLYIECAKTYRKVYTLDPHYAKSGDAIYEESLIYQEMGEKFSNNDYYKTAVNRLRLLVKDYGGNQNCPDALMRIAAIYSHQLKDETAAQDAYQQLRTKYKSSYASLVKAHPEIAAKPAASSQKAPPAPPPKDEPSAAAPTASVQNIRYWSTTDYTRVIIDLDSDASYKKEQLTNPSRIYFDISNVIIGKDLVNRTISVNDDYLKQVRVAPNRVGVARIVLEIADGITCSVSELHNPFRIVIDLRSSRSRSSKTLLPQSFKLRPDELLPIVKSKETEAPTPLSAKGINEEGLSNLTPAVIPAGKPKTKEPPKAVVDLNFLPKEPKHVPPSTGAGAEKKAESTKGGIAAKLQAAAIIQPAAKIQTEAKIQMAVKAQLAKAPVALRSDPITTPKAAPPTSQGDRTMTRVLGLKIGRIVIDPGHGGHDNGTIGPKGLSEKDLVLSMALSLKKMLQDKLGAEVILTRDSDTFIPLEERTAIANQHRADLFISIHANSSRTQSISGVETYYLGFAKTNAEREIAAKENAASEKNVSDLEDLIKKIAKADKAAESKELASLIQQKLFLGSKKMIPKTQDRGVRSAPFVVLIGAHMPSVLAEVAFISNPNDEKLLSKQANQETLVKALFTAIEGYVGALGSQMVSNQKSSK
jgi:N-acetylmuramoyl-L-alanine amidase